MVYHVIVGAGVGGLYLANRLLDNGIKPEYILLVEKRPLGEYIRFGRLNESTFERIENDLRFRIPHSFSNQIKELERALYRRLCAYKVQFIQAEFIRLQAATENMPRAVIVRSAAQETDTYPADFVFDCSGSRALVANAANEHRHLLAAPPVFFRRPLAAFNPIPHHLLAQILVENHQELKRVDWDDGQTFPEHLSDCPVETLLVLRDRLRALGWYYEAFPTFYVLRCGPLSKKVTIYTEAPPNLPENLHCAWIQLLLEINSQGKITDFQALNESRKHPSKARKLYFECPSYCMNRVFDNCRDNGLPETVIVFDALKGSDFRLGNGILSGIECLNVLLSHMQQREGRICGFDRKKIERITFQYLNKTHRFTLDGLSILRQQAIEAASWYFMNLFQQAHAVSPILTELARTQYRQRFCDLALSAWVAYETQIAAQTRWTTLATLFILNRLLANLWHAHAAMFQASDALMQEAIARKMQIAVRELKVAVMRFSLDELHDSPNILAAVRQLFFMLQKNTMALEDVALKRKVNQILQKVTLLIEPNRRGRRFVSLDIVLPENERILVGARNRRRLSLFSAETGMSNNMVAMGGLEPPTSAL